MRAAEEARKATEGAEEEEQGSSDEEEPTTKLVRLQIRHLNSC